MMVHRFQWLFMIAMTCAICFAGCFNPRNTPIFRKVAEEQDRKNAKYTEEVLQKSPDLQELDRVCTKEIPIYEGFTLISRNASSPKRTSISYYYNSGADYQMVKPFYLDYFARSAWKVTDEYDGHWGPKSVEFRKDGFRVVLYHKGMGDAEYGLHCEKLSVTGEPLPN